MTVTLSQQDYWELVWTSQTPDEVSSSNSFEEIWHCPDHLGQGFYQSLDLREGITLGISRCHLHGEDVEIVSPERSHELEYYFCLAGKVHDDQEMMEAGRYFLTGSGMAPAETWTKFSDEQNISVNIHIEPSVLQSFLGETFNLSYGKLAHLIRPNDQTYYQRHGNTTAMMQTALHQILNCPFEGSTKKVYLESKVWELTALLIHQEQQRQDVNLNPNPLKSDDVERIHHAKDILIRQLDSPPSLLDLARKVNLNDCTLKRGFRQVFGETVFGYLHNYRMEKAHQLLLAGEVNVSEASRQVGFSNRSYFASAFRKKYGVSPSQYLRRQAKNSA
ncbi:MAG: AraC family transcriptional regulator [Cyanobacteria bacterium P01_D01_bin.73]